MFLATLDIFQQLYFSLATLSILFFYISSSLNLILHLLLASVIYTPSTTLSFLPSLALYLSLSLSLSLSLPLSFPLSFSLSFSLSLSLSFPLSLSLSFPLSLFLRSHEEGQPPNYFYIGRIKVHSSHLTGLTFGYKEGVEVAAYSHVLISTHTQQDIFILVVCLAKMNRIHYSWSSVCLPLFFLDYLSISFFDLYSFVCLSVCVCVSVCLIIYTFVCLSVCLCFCLYICLCVPACVPLSLCVSICVCLSVRVCVSLTIYQPDSLFVQKLILVNLIIEIIFCLLFVCSL